MLSSNQNAYNQFLKLRPYLRPLLIKIPVRYLIKMTDKNRFISLTDLLPSLVLIFILEKNNSNVLSFVRKAVME